MAYVYLLFLPEQTVSSVEEKNTLVLQMSPCTKIVMHRSGAAIYIQLRTLIYTEVGSTESKNSMSSLVIQ